MPQVTFVSADGNREIVAQARKGETLLDVAHRHDVDLPGICEGQMLCTTCHVIVDPADYGRLPPESEQEGETLELANGLSRTSRLGCQITMTDALDGLRVRLPAAMRNAMMG